eukprot:CAMPEP_0194556962 /NCGR_PEP_ID=MMETSP0253-20130528/99006_2 /TAXON_ID=2966 /ORGANISM="Noctiluca scintillans" /LENGTH=123 /DNA_ID=CAMNT_0039404465 /DNA_START=823 /DNA_END=1193 /DNA_ORIENTATION=-
MTAAAAHEERNLLTIHMCSLNEFTGVPRIVLGQRRAQIDVHVREHLLEKRHVGSSDLCSDCSAAHTPLELIGTCIRSNRSVDAASCGAVAEDVELQYGELACLLPVLPPPKSHGRGRGATDES